MKFKNFFINYSKEDKKLLESIRSRIKWLQEQRGNCLE